MLYQLLGVFVLLGTANLSQDNTREINKPKLPDNTPVLEIENGFIEGVLENYEGHLYHSFKSIPYAEPPLNSLRFEAPKPFLDRWDKVYKANRTSPKCTQFDNDSKYVIGQEDCLYLNVFVPVQNESLSSQKCLRRKPVMVFIHGGGLMWGSSDFYGEQYIMANGDLILVTLNYRIGPFGFLSTEDSEISGNMGFKDQSLALEWVHKNIEAFGGDKEKVLLVGWSAGGASVNFHMVSDFTKNEWFSSAISMSGTALCPCHAIYNGESLQTAEKLAKLLNCQEASSNQSQTLKSCLQSQPANHLTRQIEKLYAFSNHPFAIFKPALENSLKHCSFLTDHVDNLMATGKTKRKPWLVSLTKDDGAFGTAEFLQKDSNGRELIYELNDKWLEWAPIMLFFNTSLTEAEKQSKALALKEKYLGDKDFGLDTYNNLETLYNEELAIGHADQAIRLYQKYSDSIFGYVYDNPADYGYGQILSRRDDWIFGTLHGDDMGVIFKTDIRANHPLRPDELQISKSLIEMMVEMANTGVPKYEGRVLSIPRSSGQAVLPFITKEGLVTDDQIEAIGEVSQKD